MTKREQVLVMLNRATLKERADGIMELIAERDEIDNKIVDAAIAYVSLEEHVDASDHYERLKKAVQSLPKYEPSLPERINRIRTVVCQEDSTLSNEFLDIIEEVKKMDFALAVTGYKP